MRRFGFSALVLTVALAGAAWADDNETGGQWVFVPNGSTVSPPPQYMAPPLPPIQRYGAPANPYYPPAPPPGVQYSAPPLPPIQQGPTPAWR